MIVIPNSHCFICEYMHIFCLLVLMQTHHTIREISKLDQALSLKGTLITK